MGTQVRANKGRVCGALLAVSLATLLTVAVCGWADDAIEIAIEVAPNVLNLGSKGEVVTVHTDIAYSAVVGASVMLNEIPIAWWKSDNQGCFVAKFDIDTVKGDVQEGVNVVTLTGLRTDGVAFTGTATFTVINNTPKK